MKKSEIDPLLNSIGQAIARHLTERTAPLEARLVELEARPQVAYRGVWAADRDYPSGSLVTCGGSLWSAEADSRGHRPGSAPIAGTRLWILVAKGGPRR